jgi:tetratricopeptide (TPR) repeat protein
MNEWQDCLNEGLKKDSTVAYFWQQKAMPYFKAKKYEVGMKYLDKAVLLDAQRWQPYRAFIKCIFQKSYNESIADFKDCINKWGNQYEMDHTYKFYIAICYLQLNNFNEAEFLLKEYIDNMLKKNGEEWVHPTALFYHGISLYEQKKYDEAISIFDKALKIYKNFSDVKIYKAVCMARLGKNNADVMNLLKEGKEDAKLGYSINEDNIIYETYPYQKKWRD